MSIVWSDAVPGPGQLSIGDALVVGLVDAAQEHLSASRSFAVLRASGNSKAAQVARRRLQKTDLRLQAAIDFFTAPSVEGAPDL